MSPAPSSRLTSCVQSNCAALAVPTSCVVSKNRSASSHQATSKKFFFSFKKLATHVPFDARARLLALGPTRSPFMSNLFPASKEHFAASLPLMYTVLQRFEGLQADGNLICSVLGFEPHPHSFSVVRNSFRPLVVESVDEPEANLWHRILARRCR